MRRKLRRLDIAAVLIVLGSAVVYWSRPGAPAVTVAQTGQDSVRDAEHDADREQQP
jgi:hypothetical protein